MHLLWSSSFTHRGPSGCPMPRWYGDRPDPPPSSYTPEGYICSMHATTADLNIEGMTCASCVTRVERQLNKLDGVTASVNLATETATVTFPAATPLADLITAVNQAGYTATSGDTASPQVLKPAPPRRTLATLTPRLLISLVLAVPVVLLAMTPHFPGWAWISLVL